MAALQIFLAAMDWQSLLQAALRAVLVVFCLTVHELSHGLAAYALGDETAKSSGRLSLNPLRHIDWFGLVLMLTAGVGWAKPVPVDLRHFKHPKRDMALTALAGPVSNFLLAYLFMVLCRLVWRFAPENTLLAQGMATGVVLNLGLGCFNLVPIPPLDGSRVVFSFLPDRLYYALMRWERYIMVALLALVWLGALDKPLNLLIQNGWVLLLELTSFL